MVKFTETETKGWGAGCVGTALCVRGAVGIAAGAIRESVGGTLELNSLLHKANLVVSTAQTDLWQFTGDAILSKRFTHLLYAQAIAVLLIYVFLPT